LSLFFDFYGGTDTLDNIDFIDFTIYNINDKRNFKHIYSRLNFKDNYEEDYIYKKDIIMKNMYIENFYFSLAIDNNIYYNILYKANIKNEIKKNQIKNLIKKYE